MAPSKTYVFLAFILLAQAALLYTNLADIPRWEWDDGVNMEVAWNLANGRMQMYAITYPFVPHPPLFFAVLAVLLKAFGNKLIVLRSLTAAYALLTTLLLYLTGRKISGERLGLAAAFLYAIYPENVYWSRLGMINSQLMLLTMLALYLFLRGGASRRLSYLTVSLALATEFTAAALLISVIGILYLERKPREIAWACVLSLAVPAATYAVIYSTPAREALVFDAGYALSRFLPNLSTFILTFGLLTLALLSRKRMLQLTVESWRNLRRIAVKDIAFTFGRYGRWLLAQKPFALVVAVNLFFAVRTFTPLSDDLLFKGYDKLFFDYYWVGALGILLFGGRIIRLFFMTLFLLTLALGRTDHMILPFYPFFSLGLAMLLPPVHESLTGILRGARGGKAAVVFALLLTYYPFGVILVQDVRAFVYGAGLERQDLESLMDVVAYVDEHTAPADVVLSTSHISRLIDARGAELYQGLAAEGVTVSYFGRRLPDSRFVYNSSYRGARFVVLHNQTLAWLSEKQSLGDVSAELGAWPIVYRSGRYVVYANPYKAMT